MQSVQEDLTTLMKYFEDATGMNNKKHSFEDLKEIVRKLRDPDDGCPWDLEQTHTSLKPFLIEEAYEVLEAIDDYPDRLSEELGDLLLQVMLHSQIGSEQNHFSIEDVVDSIATKLIHRHPHVFGDARAHTPEKVIENWEAIKKAERGEQSSVLDGIPRVMPALAKAEKIGRKVSRVGFDWECQTDVLDKVKEELDELSQALQTEGSERVAEEFGDLLFSLAQLARFLDVQPEIALSQANRKFEKRFRKIESTSERPIAEQSAATLAALWEQAKADE